MSTRLTSEAAGSTTVYVVARGNHVEIALDRSQSNELLDVSEVRAAPGGAPHRHAFAEYFRVLDRQLTFTEERDGVMRATHILGPGGWVFVAPLEHRFRDRAGRSELAAGDRHARVG